MKILIQNSQEPILEGVSQVLLSLEEQVLVWDGQSPINDLIDKYKPDLTICYSNIKSRPNGKLVVVGEYYGELKPDIICVSSDLPQFKKEQIANSDSASKYLFIETAANLSYSTVEHDPKYATDVFYYSQNTTPEILNYLQKIERDFQLKVIGQHRIPISSYLGAGTPKDIMKFMKSCKVALAFDKPTLYTYLANKVKCLTDQSNEFVFTFLTYEQLQERLAIDKFFDSESTWEVDCNYKTITDNHTYFHRSHNILTRLGLNEQAKKCLTQLNKILKSNLIK